MVDVKYRNDRIRKLEYENADLSMKLRDAEKERLRLLGKLEEAEKENERLTRANGAIGRKILTLREREKVDLEPFDMPEPRLGIDI